MTTDDLIAILDLPKAEWCNTRVAWELTHGAGWSTDLDVGIVARRVRVLLESLQRLDVEMEQYRGDPEAENPVSESRERFLI